MSREQHLFVVEDDVPLRDLVVDYMRQQGLAVTAMATAEDLPKRIHRLRPDLIVLDVSLPGMSGLEACQRLRYEGDRVPIILLLARSDEVDRIMGLEMGADDCLGKPFSTRELLARVRAVLRRAAMPRGLALLQRDPLPIGERIFYPATRSLRHEGRDRYLNTLEYALLSEFLVNPGVPISRERLLAVSHGSDSPALLRTIDTAVMRLRRLVEPDPASPRFIQTVCGHGYMFVPTLDGADEPMGSTWNPANRRHDVRTCGRARQLPF